MGVFYSIFTTFWTSSYEIIDPENGIHYKLTKRDGSARLYISHTDSFGPDFVDFRYKGIALPELYYVEPDTIYIIDENSNYVRDINARHFVIKHVDLLYPQLAHPDSGAIQFKNYLDSLDAVSAERAIIRAKPHYTIDIMENANGISVFNPQGELITRKR